METNFRGATMYRQTILDHVLPKLDLSLVRREGITMFTYAPSAAIPKEKAAICM